MAEEQKSQTQACNHGQTDTSKSLIAYVMEAAAIAVAAINTAAAIRMADLQYDLAKQYLDIAKWWNKYYKNTYAPWEDKELQEAKALPEVQPIYDTAVGRARTHVRLQFRGIADQSVQCTSEYCTGLRQALLRDVLVSEAASLASASNLGYNNERAYVDALNETYWRKKYEAVKRGRDMAANNVSFSDMSFGIFGDLGKQAGIGASGALRYLGYTWNREETKYPTLQRGIATRQQAATGFVGPPAPANIEVQEEWSGYVQERIGDPTSKLIRKDQYDPGVDLLSRV